MTLIAWIGWFAATSLFWKWILCWGGAEWFAGWKTILIVDWFSAVLSAEQIKLYALLCWIANGIWFAIGLVNPEYRW